MTAEDKIILDDAPDVLGLVFRRFRGEADYAGMAVVVKENAEADGLEWAITVEDMARSYSHLVNCDPYRDMVIIEVAGEIAGYSRVWWLQELEGPRIYRYLVFLRPQWRGKGIRRAVLRHNERRLHEIAEGHPDDGPRVLETWAWDTELVWASLLQDEGYRAVRYGFSMVRPDLEEIPGLPLPEGLEVRPVEPEQVMAVWEAAREAFRDHWGYSDDDWSYETLKEWQESPTYEPELWQVAWAGDEVAGMVLNFIDQEENTEYGRLRGYTETICVRRPWRRQGLARALIARSFLALKERGMTEAALGVDAENTNGALQLYRSMGFAVVKQHTTYRKGMGVG
jgi:ribosomal protein S18 acetylase RimI-like enzyme